MFPDKFHQDRRLARFLYNFALQLMFGLNQLCSAEFGAAAFMCSTHDLSHTASVANETRLAWVRLDYRAPVLGGQSSQFFNGQTCFGWKGGTFPGNALGTALTVDADGVFRTAACADAPDGRTVDPRPVACCSLQVAN